MDIFPSAAMEKTDSKIRSGKWIWTIVIVLVNLVFWIAPSDIAYNVAQHRDILLGRYTIDHTAALLLVAVASTLILIGIWSNRKRKGNQQKAYGFKIVVIFISIVVSIVAVDVFMRIARRKRYVKNQSFYYRVPNIVQHGVNKDVPPTSFSYPQTPAGYPDLDYTLTVDGRGFRNSTNFDSYDIVVLGNSFAEGSHVSDDQAWPFLLARKSNRAVYNLGMSAGSPVTYLEVFKRFGLNLSPKIVICMLYEGNDFRNANFDRGKKTERSFDLKTLLCNSPLRHRTRQALIRYLGPINSNRFKNKAANGNTNQLYTPSHPLYAVSWLPVGIPDSPDAKYYAFKIKRLLTHFVSEDTFLNSIGCRQTFEHLSEIKRICDENNIRFVVVYAPDKPHTLLPLIEDDVSVHQLHAFMALKEKNLPPVEELMGILRNRLHVQESSVGTFCCDEGIEFVSPTEPLRKSIAKGFQAYYTYDQHWTPIGHEIAADTLYKHMVSGIEILQK